MNQSITWKVVPAEPTSSWTNAFAARGPRIGTFDTTIRDVLATAPAPAFDLQEALQEVRAALAFLPPADAAVAGLDRIIAIFGTAAGGAQDDAKDNMSAVHAAFDRGYETALDHVARGRPALAAGDAQTAAARDVMAERQRQVQVEGRTPQSDDAYVGKQLADAATAYAASAAGWVNLPATTWPWDRSWFKPRTPREDLVRAGALILAEIERLDRAAIAAQQGKGEKNAV